MNILFAPMNGGRGLGPLTRCLAVADVCRRRGHKVHFLSKASFSEIARSYGFASTDSIQPIKKFSTREQLAGASWPDIAVYLGLTESAFIDASIEAESRLLKIFHPDCAFIESNLTMPLTCLENSVPYFSTITWADSPSLQLATMQVKPSRALDSISDHNKHLRRIGLQEVDNLFTFITKSASQLIIPATKSIQPELQFLSHATYVGHLLFDQFEYSQSAGKFSGRIAKSYIYAYLSTSDFSDHEFLTNLGAAAKGAGFAVVALSKTKYNCGDNVSIYESISGGKAISGSALVVHPGTANTMVGALIHGVPQLMLPFEDSERRYNAERVSALNLGLILEEESMTSLEKITEKIRLMNTDQSFRQSALQAGSEIHNSGGPSVVVDLMEKRFQ